MFIRVALCWTPFCLVVMALAGKVRVFRAFRGPQISFCFVVVALAVHSVFAEETKTSPTLTIKAKDIQNGKQRIIGLLEKPTVSVECDPQLDKRVKAYAFEAGGYCDGYSENPKWVQEFLDDSLPVQNPWQKPFGFRSFLYLIDDNNSLGQDPATFVERAPDKSKAHVLKTREDVRALFDTAGSWLEAKHGGAKFMFCANTLPAYGNSTIDIHAWVFRSRSKHWDKLFSIRTNGVGKLGFSVDPKTGGFSAKGAANNKFKNKTVFSFDLNATEGSCAHWMNQVGHKGSEQTRSAAGKSVAAASMTGQRIPVVKGSKERPSIVVWREDWGLVSAKGLGPFVIAAVWADGKVVWSKDKLSGGPPFHEGKIDPKALDKVLHDFEVRNVFSAPYVRHSNFGPDSYCTAIYLSKGKKEFLSRSWHELAEQDPGIVAASFGLTRLKDMSREEFLKNDAQDYQKYRALWSHIRKQISAILPKDAKEKALSFEFSKGN